MLILAIETSNPTLPAPAMTGVCVGRIDPADPARGVIAEVRCEVLGQATLAPLEETGRDRDDLLPCIQRAMSAAAIKPRDLDAIAVSVGPGGFAALRMAVAAAKLMAEAAGAQRGAPLLCVGVPTAAVVRVGAVLDGTVDASLSAWVALGAKGESVYLTTFGPLTNANALAQATANAAPVDKVESIGLTTAGGPIFAGALLGDKHTPAWLIAHARTADVHHRGTPCPIFSNASPRACLIASAWYPRIDPVELLPLYGREPEAVSLWRKLHPRSAGPAA